MRKAIFLPRPMGIFVFVIIILGFAATALRQELALLVTSAVFLALWVYCLIMTLLLALIQRRRARRSGIRISPREIAAGQTAEAVYYEEETTAFKGKIVQLPGIVVRCRLLLATKDSRSIRYELNPSDPAPHIFTVKKRGAYFSAHSEFAVFDVLGFFRFAFRMNEDRLSAESDVRLLASPLTADEPPTVNARAGDSMLKPQFAFQRTDNLIDHRPYVPGDDPRRINWKLYGHGGDLFVREGEYEPPPQSNIVILVDTEYDPLLYNLQAAQNGIDLLCENALAAALACAESGMEVHIGYTGGVIRGGNAEELASSLAWPAAIPLVLRRPLSAAAHFPAVSNDCGVLILALPRSSAETSAIDHFLSDAAHGNTGKSIRTIELLFLYDSAIAASECVSAAETCVALYNQRHGVRARLL